MKPNETKNLIKKTARAERKAFAKAMPKGEEQVTIQWGLPYLGVKLANGKEYFFQGEAASEILENCVNQSNEFQIGVEDVILFTALSWG